MLSCQGVLCIINFVRGLKQAQLSRSALSRGVFIFIGFVKGAEVLNYQAVIIFDTLHGLIFH